MNAKLRLSSRLPELFTDDRTLLGRFIERRDDAAFASLVKRHGGFVLGVCRRVLRDSGLAEDAFQAVFLVLAKNPQAAANAISVSGWLFGTARRVSLAARRAELRRRNREHRAARPEETPNRDWDDLLLAVDEELAKLPGENREALIACFLREQTQDEAARELGWSLSTLRRRLERGKELLKARLTRRGAALSAALFAGVLAPSNAHAVPSELLKKAGDASAASASALKLAAAGSLPKLPLAALGLVIAAVVVGAFAPRIEAEAKPISTNLVAAPVPPPKPEWVTISGHIVFPADRDIPERREIKKTDGFLKDAECCLQDGRRLFFENLLVEPKKRGLANAVVWLRPDSLDRDATLPEHKIRQKPKPRERIVEVKDCQFVPRITVARTGDTIRFKNPAPLATNVMYDSTSRGAGSNFAPVNVLLAAKTGDYTAAAPLQRSRNVDLFKSSIYPWMQGCVWCFDHPYAAVTDADGKFTIPDAPVGSWRLVVWHEEYGYTGGTFKGRAVTFDKDVTLDPIPFDIVKK